VDDDYDDLHDFDPKSKKVRKDMYPLTGRSGREASLQLVDSPTLDV
jgi:hypothetical protein